MSTSPLDATNFDLATAIPQSIVPAASGSPESLLVAGLQESQNYSFALRAADEIPNWSPVSNVAVGATPGAAPFAVSDLAVTKVTLHTVTLHWSAPADNGSNGAVADYALRYSTTPITDANWLDATIIPEGAGVVPGPAGTPQECTASGLPAFTPLYFGIRSRDAAQNVSAASNAAAAITDRPGSESEVIEALAHTYARRELDAYTSLLGTADDSASFVYGLSEPLTDGTENWDGAEEVRIHRRMFAPASIPPAEPPLPVELWLTSIDVALNPLTAWAERPQFYYDPTTNPLGLHAERWRVTGADFSHLVFFETQGDTDYRTEGRSEFVVVDDLELQAGEPRKFLLYRWYDLGDFAKGLPGTTQTMTWSGLKALYR